MDKNKWIEEKVKEPTIKQVGFYFWVNGKKHEYKNYSRDTQDLVVCKCKNKTFFVYQPKGHYETSIICTKCYESYLAHDE